MLILLVTHLTSSKCKFVSLSTGITIAIVVVYSALVTLVWCAKGWSSSKIASRCFHCVAVRLSHLSSSSTVVRRCLTSTSLATVRARCNFTKTRALHPLYSRALVHGCVSFTDLTRTDQTKCVN